MLLNWNTGRRAGTSNSIIFNQIDKDFFPWEFCWVLGSSNQTFVISGGKFLCLMLAARLKGHDWMSLICFLIDFKEDDFMAFLFPMQIWCVRKLDEGTAQYYWMGWFYLKERGNQQRYCYYCLREDISQKKKGKQIYHSTKRANVSFTNTCYLGDAYMQCPWMHAFALHDNKAD